MKSKNIQDKEVKRRRIPSHLRLSLPRAGSDSYVTKLLKRHSLRTVCQEAHCPNKGECFSRGVATFMILGDVCTRGCAFCGVKQGKPRMLDPDEPRRVARAASELRLCYVVVTSVTRDDLPDGGAGYFAQTASELRRELPRATVEFLLPDFLGRRKSWDVVIESGLDVFSHNVETVPRLYNRVRRGADYHRSISLLRYARDNSSGLAVKSGFMLGLGESWEELEAVMIDLVDAGVEQLVVGQYLKPRQGSFDVVDYFPPEYFLSIEETARSMGIAHVYARPLARTSYALALKKPD